MSRKSSNIDSLPVYIQESTKRLKLSKASCHNMGNKVRALLSVYEKGLSPKFFCKFQKEVPQ